MIIIIRADASTQMGTGHVMRCIALAQAWQEQGGAVVMVSAEIPTLLRDRLGVENIESRLIEADNDAQATIQIAQEIGAEWVVVDGYQFDSYYQRMIKSADLQLLFIDDYGHCDAYCADFVLNQNSYADSLLYAKREPYTQLLLGSRYVLLRREFWQWRGWQRPQPQTPYHVLVTLGGSDPDNVTGKVIDALHSWTAFPLQLTVLVGGGNPHYEDLEARVKRSPHRVELRRNVTDMPRLMSEANIAISAGGSTCWELAFMGLPNLIIVLAENQVAVGKNLDEVGVASNLGWWHELSAETICQQIQTILGDVSRWRAMSTQGQLLVNGYGGQQVVTAISLGVRPATMGDAKLLFEWANDPFTRQMSFHSEPIVWDKHIDWLQQQLNQPDVKIVIVEKHIDQSYQPIGQVRIDGKGILSISLNPSFRGRHLAQSVLETVLDKFAKFVSLPSITAYIKKENIASQKIFSRAGFSFYGHSTINGHSCFEYRYTNDSYEN